MQRNAIWNSEYFFYLLFFFPFFFLGNALREGGTGFTDPFTLTRVR